MKWIKKGEKHWARTISLRFSLFKIPPGITLNAFAGSVFDTPDVCNARGLAWSKKVLLPRHLGFHVLIHDK